VFFEQDRSAAKLLQGNIRALGVSDRSKVVSSDLFRWFENPDESVSAGIVFLDPPYRFLRERIEALQLLGKRISEHHLAAGGIVVFRHDAADRLELPHLVRYDEREYGGMTLEFLRAGP
jgi:16S rRNA G966 N2-methylase RsmD